MNRRTMLSLLLCAGVQSVAATIDTAHAATPQRRLISLDWVLTELLLSIGVVPVGVANTHGFSRSFPACDLPSSVVDLGLMFQPNMEVMLALKPDLILITPAHASLRTALERIAPTVTLGEQRANGAPYTTARDETLRLARLLDCEPRARATLAQADAALDRDRAQLHALRDADSKTPLYLTQFIDESHLRVFGPHSFHGELMTRLGLRNAWQHPTNAAAFATTTVDALDDTPNATLLYFKPLPAAAATMMTTSPIWRAMPFASADRMIGLPYSPRDGGMLSAMYFARTLTEALANMPSPGKTGANA